MLVDIPYDTAKQAEEIQDYMIRMGLNTTISSVYDMAIEKFYDYIFGLSGSN